MGIPATQKRVARCRTPSLMLELTSVPMTDLEKAKQINERIGLRADGRISVWCAGAWESSMIIANLQSRIEDLERRLDRQDQSTPKTLSLYDFLLKKNGTMFSKNAICDIVKSWLIDHTVIESEDAEKLTFTICKEQLQRPN